MYVFSISQVASCETASEMTKTVSGGASVTSNCDGHVTSESSCVVCYRHWGLQGHCVCVVLQFVETAAKPLIHIGLVRVADANCIEKVSNLILL